MTFTVDGEVTAREQPYRGRDEAQHPWRVRCRRYKCYWAVCADTEQQGWAKLEEHRLSDRCPQPLLYHGKAAHNS